jgi:membrane protease YdiL (CAAX protease family)
VLIRLFGSAFVIAVAEEIFFRKFLIDFAGFWWMVVLFAIEHDRFLVAFIAGVIYGIVKIKVSLKSAIIAHIVTNFILGIHVIRFAKWQFW